MQAFHNLKLTGLFADVIITDVKINQKYNHHATICVEGNLPDGVGDSFILRTLEMQPIRLVVSGENDDEVVFQGLVTEAKTRHRRGVYSIEIQGISNSYLMDIGKHFCSFQDIAMTFDQVIQACMENYNGSYINEDALKDEPVDCFTLQYNETEWEFIKRLISRHNEGFVPDIQSEKLAYWIGMPSGRKERVIGDSEYACFRQIGKARGYIDNFYVNNATENDFFYYLLPKRIERFLLGDRINFEKLSWRIFEIYSYLDTENATMRHDYTLVNEAGCRQPTLFNTQIRGLSLEGRVIDRRKDFTKVHLLSIDEEQAVDPATWFRQPTYYTAGKDSGWCAMPELNDMLSLHFPTKEENDAFLMDATQVDYESGIFPNVNLASKAGKNPSAPQAGENKTAQTIVNSKFINAPNGQNLVLEDDMIRFSAKDGVSILSLFPEHADASGATLGVQYITDNDLKMTAKRLSFGEPNGLLGTPSKKIVFHGMKDVVLSCQESSVLLNHATEKADYYAAEIEFLDAE